MRSLCYMAIMITILLVSICETQKRKYVINIVLDITVEMRYTISIEIGRRGDVKVDRVRECLMGESFNYQMSWIDETVTHMIKHNLKPKIMAEGREAYGQKGYTHALNRIFNVIKNDPKNRERIDEVAEAEQALKDYLYDGAYSDEEMLSYWRIYTENYINELSNM